MSKHTPGPWHRNIKPVSRYPVIFAGRNTHIASVESRNLPEDEAEANCRLITAAPDLLAALIRIAAHESRADRRHKNMVDVSELVDLRRIACTAIAKAENKV